MDTDSAQLIHRLRLLQCRLYEMADDLGDLTDPEIVAVSEEADRLIVQLQRLYRIQTEQKKSGMESGSILPVPEAPEEVG